MADVNGTINVEVLYREAGSPGSGGGAPGNGGGTASGSEAAEEKKKKQEMSQQTIPKRNIWLSYHRCLNKAI